MTMTSIRSTFYTDPNTSKKRPLTIEERAELKSHAVIFVNWDFEDKHLSVKRVREAAQIIGINEGTRYCFEHGFEPNEVIGDLDSIHPLIAKAYKKNPKILFGKKEDPNSTNLEYTLKNRINWEKIQQVTILGGLDEAADQMMTNFLFLARYAGRVYLDSTHLLVFSIGDDADIIQPTNKPIKKVDINSFPGQKFSIYPLAGKASVKSTGLKWNLENFLLSVNSVSKDNESLGEKVTLKATNGIALVFMKKLNDTNRKVSPPKRGSSSSFNQKISDDDSTLTTASTSSNGGEDSLEDKKSKIKEAKGKSRSTSQPGKGPEEIRVKKISAQVIRKENSH